MSRAAAGLLMLACALPAAAQAVDGAALVDQAFARALTTGNLDAIALLFAPDAQAFPVGQAAAHGRDEIRAAFARLLERGAPTGFELSEARYESQGTLSVGWGRWTMRRPPGADAVAPAPLQGRFTSVVLNLDGKWFYVSLHLSGDPSPPAQPDIRLDEQAPGGLEEPRPTPPSTAMGA